MPARFALALTALSLITAVSAHAEPLVALSDDLGNDEKLVLSLPAGPVEITMDQATGTELIVSAGRDKQVKIDSAYMPRLLKTYRDSLLLELNTGGNACPILFGWVTFDAKGLRASEDFGTCAEDANYEETEKGPVVSMDDLHNPGHTASYLYNPTTNDLTKTGK
ncbi:hypothetical protein NIBR502774_14245 (plasmid) [Rhizobium sp. NIBRBAC000502774]|nr:hypothetical protein NIBR502774_14245 [Rhizobium sp. NIBRBAC000502774]